MIQISSSRAEMIRHQFNHQLRVSETLLKESKINQINPEYNFTPQIKNIKAALRTMRYSPNILSLMRNPSRTPAFKTKIKLPTLKGYLENSTISPEDRARILKKLDLNDDEKSKTKTFRSKRISKSNSHSKLDTLNKDLFSDSDTKRAKLFNIMVKIPELHKNGIPLRGKSFRIASPSNLMTTRRVEAESSTLKHSNKSRRNLYRSLATCAN